MGFLRTSLHTQHFEEKATVVPWYSLRFARLGQWVAIMSYFKAAERILRCIAFTSAVASNQDCALVTSLAVPSRVDDRLWQILLQKSFRQVGLKFSDP